MTTPDTCWKCGAPEETILVDHPYDALPGVVLVGLESTRCTNPECEESGEGSLTYPSLGKLNRYLAHLVIRQVGPLPPKHVIFLRKHLGWGTEEMGAGFGVPRNTVLGWESGPHWEVRDRSIPPLADRLLRVLVAMQDGDTKFVGLLHTVAQTETTLAPMRLRPSEWITYQG